MLMQLAWSSISWVGLPYGNTTKVYYLFVVTLYGLALTIVAARCGYYRTRELKYIPDDNVEAV